MQFVSNFITANVITVLSKALKSLFQYISNKMQRYTVYFIWKLAGVHGVARDDQWRNLMVFFPFDNQTD
jgi:hypothetical protein